MHANKGGEEEEEEEEEEGMLHQNYLDLRLGVSPNNDTAEHAVNTASSNREAKDSKMILSMMTGFGGPIGPSAGFVHPWSLAARQQQKAAFEQAHHMSIPSSSSSSSSSSTLPRFTAPPPPPTVGWPPVRAVRRISVASQSTKHELEGEKDAKKSKVAHDPEDRTKIVVPEAGPTLFVKVNMEGFGIGRKINLKAHPSYDSLSSTLQKMFDNFLSANYSNKSTEEEQVDGACIDHILLYEDHEGDRMLVGDVPWEMFITSVKRLYIAYNPKSQKIENKKEGAKRLTEM